MLTWIVIGFIKYIVKRFKENESLDPRVLSNLSSVANITIVVCLRENSSSSSKVADCVFYFIHNTYANFVNKLHCPYLKLIRGFISAVTSKRIYI